MTLAATAAEPTRMPGGLPCRAWAHDHFVSKA